MQALIKSLKGTIKAPVTSEPSTTEANTIQPLSLSNLNAAGHDHDDDQQDDEKSVNNDHMLTARMFEMAKKAGMEAGAKIHLDPALQTIECLRTGITTIIISTTIIHILILYYYRTTSRIEEKEGEASKRC